MRNAHSTFQFNLIYNTNDRHQQSSPSLDDILSSYLSIIIIIMTQKNELVSHEVCEEKNANVTLMWRGEREMRRMEVLLLNGYAIKMDVKPIEWKGLIPLGTVTDIAQDKDWYRSGHGLIRLGTGTDMVQEWDKERGLAYAVRGVCLP